MPKILFPLLLGLLTIVQLESCLRSRTAVRQPTKVLLMPFTALVYLAFAEHPSALVVAGLLFGCLGDLALLWPLRSTPFLLGVLAFAAGHICYLVFLFTTYTITAGTVRIVLIALAYLAGCAAVYIKTRPDIPKAVRIAPFPYMLILAAVSAVTLLILLSSADWGRALAALGAALFLASDAVLSDMLFAKKAEPPVQNFVVMLTYTPAQILMALGWAMA